MPQLSDTMTEGTLVKWLKNEGEKVSSGETIAEIEKTDKAVMEMEVFDAGVVARAAGRCRGQKANGGGLFAGGNRHGLGESRGGEEEGRSSRSQPAAAVDTLCARAASPVSRQEVRRFTKAGYGHVAASAPSLNQPKPAAVRFVSRTTLGTVLRARVPCLSLHSRTEKTAAGSVLRHWLAVSHEQRNIDLSRPRGLRSRRKNCPTGCAHRATRPATGVKGGTGRTPPLECSSATA